MAQRCWCPQPLPPLCARNPSLEGFWPGTWWHFLLPTCCIDASFGTSLPPWPTWFWPGEWEPPWHFWLLQASRTCSWSLATYVKLSACAWVEGSRELEVSLVHCSWVLHWFKDVSTCFKRFRFPSCLGWFQLTTMFDSFLGGDGLEPSHTFGQVLLGQQIWLLPFHLLTFDLGRDGTGRSCSLWIHWWSDLGVRFCWHLFGQFDRDALLWGPGEGRNPSVAGLETPLAEACRKYSILHTHLDTCYRDISWVGPNLHIPRLSRRGLRINLLFGDFIEVAYPFMEKSLLVNLAGYVASGLSVELLTGHSEDVLSSAYLPLPAAILLARDPLRIFRAYFAAFSVSFTGALLNNFLSTTARDASPCSPVKKDEWSPGCAKFTAALHETASWPHAQKTQGIPLSSSFTFAGYPWLPNGYPSAIFSLLLQPSVLPSVARRPILIILLWYVVVSSWGLKTIILPIYWRTLRCRRSMGYEKGDIIWYNMI